MELRIVNADPKYSPPVFAPPPESGYLYLAAAVAPPAGPPFVRRNADRDRLLAELRELAGDLRALPEVRTVSVYRAVLVPPAPRVSQRARYDVAVLIETTSPEALDEMRATSAYQAVHRALTAAARTVHVMPARCLRSLGDVDRGRQGLFLFNHFVGADAETATRLWEHLAAWYVAETGLDNSTLLAPLDEDGYVFVNHARWDKGVLRLALEQFGRKTFRTYVRANLKANDVVAMPVLYRLAS